MMTSKHWRGDAILRMKGTGTKVEGTSATGEEVPLGHFLSTVKPPVVVDITGQPAMPAASRKADT